MNASCFLRRAKATSPTSSEVWELRGILGLAGQGPSPARAWSYHPQWRNRVNLGGGREGCSQGQSWAQGIRLLCGARSRQGWEVSLQVRVRIRPNEGNQSQRKPQDGWAGPWWQDWAEVSNPGEDSFFGQDKSRTIMCSGKHSLPSPSPLLIQRRPISFSYQWMKFNSRG